MSFTYDLELDQLRVAIKDKKRLPILRLFKDTELISTTALRQYEDETGYRHALLEAASLAPFLGAEDASLFFETTDGNYAMICFTQDAVAGATLEDEDAEANTEVSASHFDKDTLTIVQGMLGNSKEFRHTKSLIRTLSRFGHEIETFIDVNDPELEDRIRFNTSRQKDPS